ncbi:predicted protein [Sclerotinia sclerotiorum 1980 UF-70]|uniref:Uncharacterized protein n=1 Tax=Sclerotinia sclerotiorum (strain ATCC 18683 / 1980 / Ss-1) TaxID=665079 RepID=A7EUS4_SCLS1|nr:predicted protein [Sclerotinia sclerotiorum 1980 UF-70]EDN93216.1 predicted protein [Sclerotinia sclerotiorum 1980 UF-70]
MFPSTEDSGRVAGDGCLVFSHGYAEGYPKLELLEANVSNYQLCLEKSKGFFDILAKPETGLTVLGDLNGRIKNPFMIRGI